LLRLSRSRLLTTCFNIQHSHNSLSMNFKEVSQFKMTACLGKNTGVLISP
jgi:hypothetical protein